MGLFKKKRKVKKLEPVEATEQVFDEQYREELRQLGRDHFKKLLVDNSAGIKQDVDAVLAQLTATLRRHMASQLDLAITRVNSDISSSIKEQMIEHNRVSGEAQELVVQSLSRNAQAVHEKYQQMSSNLQQVVANQEVMMVGVFQDNQSRVATIQSEQDKLLAELRTSIEEAKRQSDEAVRQLKQSSEEQSRTLQELYGQTTGGASQMKQSQEQAISQLEQSVASLEEQHQRLQQMIDESIAKQKTMATEMVNEHMARIIEHYVIGALGERSDVAKDLPNILEKMQENKQAMMDDLSL